MNPITATTASLPFALVRDDLCQALLGGGLINLERLHAPANLNEWDLASTYLNYGYTVIQCAGVKSKAALLTKIADALAFPEHFGMNLDALYDCLTDYLLAQKTQKKSGTVLVLEGASTLSLSNSTFNSTFNSVLETLLDACELMQPKKYRLCILII